MPTGVFGLVEIVSVVFPEPDTDVGLNDEFVRPGTPLTLKLTTEENGPNAVTDTVNFALEFRLTVWLLGDAAIEKSATTRVT